MKTIKITLMVALLSATTFFANAQSRGNSSATRTSSNQRSSSAMSSNSSSRSSARNSAASSNQSNKPTKTVKSENVTYKKSNPKVVVYRTNDKYSAKEVKHNNKSYYVDNGIFYHKVNNNYVKIAAPRGIQINVLPVGYVEVHLGNRLYFYFEGNYYNKTNNYYEVVQPPIGMIVEALPVDYEKVVVNGETLYEYNGVLYDKVHYAGGRGYEVVGYID